MLNRRHLTTIAGIIALVFVVAFFYQQKLKSKAPTISAGIRINEIGVNYIELNWIVENKSQQNITFDENHIMKVELNGREVLNPTQPCTLKPGEKITMNLSLGNIDPDESNRLKISAITNEGTTATIEETIYPPH